MNVERTIKIENHHQVNTEVKIVVGKTHQQIVKFVDKSMIRDKIAESQSISYNVLLTYKEKCNCTVKSQILP